MAQPRRFDGFGDNVPVPADHARLLGYLIGDGYVGGKTPVNFINVQQALIDDVTRIAATLGCAAHPQGRLSIALSHRSSSPILLLMSSGICSSVCSRVTDG